MYTNSILKNYKVPLQRIIYGLCRHNCDDNDADDDVLSSNVHLKAGCRPA